MVLGSCAEQVIQEAVRGGRESEFLAVAEEAGQDMGSEQLLRKVSCRECLGDVSGHCPASRRSSGLRGETSMNGGPQLMTL